MGSVLKRHSVVILFPSGEPRFPVLRGLLTHTRSVHLWIRVLHRVHGRGHVHCGAVLVQRV